MERKEIEAIGAVVVDCAFRVHRDVGPGLLESVYKVLLAQQLELQGCLVEIEKEIPLTINGIHFNKAFIADLVVNHAVIIETKSVERIHPVFHKQLITYLRLTRMKLGYLINFKEELIKNGIHRVVNGL